MKVNNISDLIGDLQKTLSQLEKLRDFYRVFNEDRNNIPAGKPYDLIVLANIFCDFYTCIETGFLRISKFFENNLDSDRWHQHLLDKMTMDIPDIRKRLIEDSEYNVLLDFLKFRHFKRYYFEYEYDRERMDYLHKKYNQAYTIAVGAFERYILFLEDLGK